MLSRALSLATVTLLIGGFAAIPVRAQNLEAGKSPSQIFAGTCNACHKSPRGLLKTVSPGSLPGFLRQHYTTSGEMAALLASFLVSNGATDTRYVGSQPKAAKDAKSDAKPAGPPDQLDRFGRRQRPPAAAQEEAAKPEAAPEQAAKPDADGAAPPADPVRPGRSAKRLPRPTETPDAAKPAGVDGQPAPAAQAAGERGPDGRKSGSRTKLGKKGKPGTEEPPKTDTAKDESPAGGPAKGDAAKSETAKDEGNKPEGVKPPTEAKSEPAKPDAPKPAGEAPVLRADPVPAVTPAPKSADGETRPAQTVTTAPPPPPAAPAASTAPAAPAASTAPAAPAESAPVPAVTASAPPPAPAGPPTPPISQ